MTTPQNISQVHSNRIVLLDALRGFALFGLFIIHMVEYFELYWFKPEPGWIHDVTFFVFGGKAYAIFALLFGASFFIIMDKQAQKQVNYRGRFAWRLLLLGMLGYLHGLIYSGDILQVLAVLGLPLLLVYRWPTWISLGVAALFLLQVPAIAFFLTSLNFPELVPKQPLHYAFMGRTFEALANGSFYQVLANNAFNGQAGKWLFMLESGRAWSIIGFSILGMCLARLSIFERSSALIKYLLLFIVGLSVFAWLTALLAVNQSGFEGLSKWILTGIFRNYHDGALAAVLALLFICIYHLKNTARYLNTLAPCGRMSLSIYVMQSIFCVPLFYGYGLGWYATIGQFYALIIGLIFWIVQLILAHFWLKNYHYGPLEWVWRSATLLRIDVPFKKVI